MAYNTFKGMRVDQEQLQTHAVKFGWLLLEPKGRYEICRYRLKFQGRLRLLVLYRNEKGEGFARVLFTGLRSDEARQVNLDFFREIREAVKWDREGLDTMPADDAEKPQDAPPESDAR